MDFCLWDYTHCHLKAPKHLYVIGIIIITLTDRTKKLRLREAEELARGHAAFTGQGLKPALGLWHVLLWF